DVSGTVGIAGQLQLVHLPGFSPLAGSVFEIIDAIQILGQFSKVTGAVVDSASARYLAPNYRPRKTSLFVQNATVTAPATAGRGSPVTIDGAGFRARRERHDHPQRPRGG